MNQRKQKTRPRKLFPKAPGRRVCQFCLKKMDEIDYKAIDILKKYVSDRGKILHRRSTKCCAKHQRALTTAIKRARDIALLPYTVE